MKYWGGTPRDSGRCACGMTGSCAENRNCNCDANDDVWREDSGSLTSKEDLPVISLRYENEYALGIEVLHVLFHRLPLLLLFFLFLFNGLHFPAPSCCCYRVHDWPFIREGYLKSTRV